MGFPFRKVFGAMAPMLGAALESVPFGGMALEALKPALGLADGAKVEDVQRMIADGKVTGEQWAAVKAAEQQFILDMKKLEIESVEKLEELAVEDRDSARKREIAVRDKTPQILAYIYTAGFLAVLGSEIWISIKGFTINPLAAKSIDILLGALLGMVLGTKEYYFGSSSGSARKTELLAQTPPIPETK